MTLTDTNTGLLSSYETPARMYLVMNTLPFVFIGTGPSLLVYLPYRPFISVNL